MTWAQDQRIAWIKERIDAGHKVNRADLVAKFYITLQTATATLHKFRERHAGAMVYDGKSKAFWAPNKAPSDIDWKARAEAAEQALEGFDPNMGDLWWIAGDEDPGFGDPLEAYEAATDYGGAPDHPVQLSRARSLSDVWAVCVVLTRDDEGEPEETEVRVFATKAEAEAAQALIQKEPTDGR